MKNIFFISLTAVLLSVSSFAKEIVISKKEFKKGNDNLSEILLQADSKPYQDPKTKEVIGFKITEIAKGSIYEKLQIKAGDIITSVNNQPLRSVADAAQIYAEDKLNRLMGGDENSVYKVNLLRNNKKETLIYRIKN